MSFPISPGVNVREIDLTTGTPVVSTSIGACVGQFTWGPVDERVLVSSEVVLRDTFNKPNDDNFVHYYTAANFLSYSNNLRVCRVTDDDTALNATTDGVGKLVKNDVAYVSMDPDQGGAADATATAAVGSMPYSSFSIFASSLTSFTDKLTSFSAKSFISAIFFCF